MAKYTSTRTLLAILTGRKAKIHQMDVNTAFLNSDLNETVYIEQPEGFEIPGKEDFMCLLQKERVVSREIAGSPFLNVLPAQHPYLAVLPVLASLHCDCVSSDWSAECSSEWQLQRRIVHIQMDLRKYPGGIERGEAGVLEQGICSVQLGPD